MLQTSKLQVKGRKLPTRKSETTSQAGPKAPWTGQHPHAITFGSVPGKSEGAFLMKTVGIIMKNYDSGAQGWEAVGESGGGFSERQGPEWLSTKCFSDSTKCVRQNVFDTIIGR